MSKYFEVELPKKSHRITKEQRRIYNGKPHVQIEKELSGLPYDPNMIKIRQRSNIESKKWKAKQVRNA